MSQSQPDRLHRIEATLDRVALAYENEFKALAELRASVEALNNSAKFLTVTAYQQQLASEAFLQSFNKNQENFMKIIAEIRNMRQNTE